MMYVHYEQAVEAMTKGMSQAFIADSSRRRGGYESRAGADGGNHRVSAQPAADGGEQGRSCPPARALTERARKTAKTAFPSPRRRGRGFCRPKKRMCKKLRLNSDENRRYD